MAIQAGDTVQDPRVSDRVRLGRVLKVRTNPACLMRVLLIRWEDGADLDGPGDEEELEEIAFGSLDD
jgi:hypothetical protein